MSGRVQREMLQKFWKNADIPEVEFLMDSKTGYAMKFNTRQDALNYFHFVEHYTRDDMRFVYWLNEEDIRCDIMTGRYLEQNFSTDGYGNGLTCNGFWTCDVCGQIYDKTLVIKCHKHMDDCSDSLVQDLLHSGILNDREEEEIISQLMG